MIDTPHVWWGPRWTLYCISTMLHFLTDFWQLLKQLRTSPKCKMLFHSLLHCNIFVTWRLLLRSKTDVPIVPLHFNLITYSTEVWSTFDSWKCIQPVWDAQCYKLIAMHCFCQHWYLHCWLLRSKIEPSLHEHLNILIYSAEVWLTFYSCS